MIYLNLIALQAMRFKTIDLCEWEIYFNDHNKELKLRISLLSMPYIMELSKQADS